ncbi:MAG: hypothetical protein SWL02_07500 [Pseudomonadota bacterium]|nr:hypothetical protein [Pseudomonadota bacterium]
MKKLLLLVTLAFSSLIHAEGFKTEEETKAFADKLMDHFVVRKIEKGLDMAKPYWPLLEFEHDGMLNLLELQWEGFDQRFGQAVGVEFLKEERIGKTFLRYYYLHKLENHAIYWQLDFYKPKDEWIINQIYYVDTLDILYE